MKGQATWRPGIEPGGPRKRGASRPYSIVRGFLLYPEGCTLVAEDPSRSKLRVELSSTPDRSGVDAWEQTGFHPMAVRLCFDESRQPTCTAWFRTPGGPKRLAISEGVAVALCINGTHTTVCGFPAAVESSADER